MTFDEWWAGSKYRQVVHGTQAMKQIAADGWNAAMQSIAQDPDLRHPAELSPNEPPVNDFLTLIESTRSLRASIDNCRWEMDKLRAENKSLRELGGRTLMERDRLTTKRVADTKAMQLALLRMEQMVLHGEWYEPETAMQGLRTRIDDDRTTPIT